MDFHILVVIACVFLASLGSLLFINKFLRRKTFEEIVAEKKAMTEKIYGKEKVLKKPKKQALKKELKREKKQRQREQATTTEQEDSDGPSEQPSVDGEPQGLSKTHVEFEPDPDILVFNNQTTSRRSSNAEKENINNKQNKNKKEKKLGVKSAILIHKNDQNILKETTTAEIKAQPSNNLDVKIPKDAVELKKVEKKDEKGQPSKKDKSVKKIDNRQTVDKSLNVDSNIQPVTEMIAASITIKEVKQLDEKVRQSSPKNNQQKSKQQNKKQKDLKDVVGLEKLSESDTVGVSLLMNLFRRAELNRSEIQILIDYLLNRQQDMPSSHSEWSDDICQKLKRQLEEKEKALLEEQEASIGIQAKLRELRCEINAERATMTSTIKSYVDKIQTKDQDIALLEQKIKTLNDNLSLERQQFQAKLIHEKQSGSQDLLAQLQMMQNEISHKDKCITELTCLVNASRQAVEESQQKNEIIQNQAQQLLGMDQQREEFEKLSNNRIFEMEKYKQLESELKDAQIEIRKMQNALESSISDVNQKNLELESLKNELTLVCNKGIKEKQQEITTLQAKNAELTQQILNISSQTQEQTGLQNNIETLRKQISEKEKLLLESQTMNSQMQQQLSLVETASKQQAAELSELQKVIEALKNDISSKTQQLRNTEIQAENHEELQKVIESLKSDIQEKEQQLQENIQKSKKHEELQKLVDSLKADVFKKSQQLQNVEKETETLYNREKELLQQLHEQKEKNNDLRTKNWKLVEALQNAEAKFCNKSPNAILVQQEKMLGVSESPSLHGVTNAEHDNKVMRDLLQRLCPEAVKICAGSALSVSFNQWLEEVLTTQFKHLQQASSSHKSTQSSSLQSPSAPQHNSYSNDHSANGSRSSIYSVNNSPGCANRNIEEDDLLKENSILRVRIEELTKLARKTENTLSDLMKQAEEQDEHWRNIVHSKDEQIKALQHSNGQGDI